MEPLSERIRYEEPSYIEEYAAELSHPIYSITKQRVDFSLVIGKYFYKKRYGNPRKKSLLPAAPKVYYGQISMTEQDIEWKIGFGPYALAEGLSKNRIIEDIHAQLSKHRLVAREGSLEELLEPLFLKMGERYSGTMPPPE